MFFYLLVDNNETNSIATIFDIIGLENGLQHDQHDVLSSLIDILMGVSILKKF